MNAQPSLKVRVLILATALAMIFVVIWPQVMGSFKESFEDNAIESGYVKEYLLPSRNSGPLAIAVDDSGMVWYAATNISRIGRFNPGEKTFAEYDIPTQGKVTMIWSMAFDEKENLWFTSTSDNSVWKFNKERKEFKRYEIPTKNSFPIQLAIDRLGRVWFTELFGNKIGVLEPSNGSIMEYSPPTKDSGPAGILVGNDGSVWFAQSLANKIAKYEPEIERFTEYEPQGKVSSPVGIVMDDEGSVWVTEHGGGSFGRFVVSNGTLLRYPTSPAKAYPVTLPYWIQRDSLGRIWFNEHTGNRMAVFDPRANVLVEYEVSKGKLVNVLQFAVGKRGGEVWFTQWTENKIAMLNVTKSILFRIFVEPPEISIKPGESVRVSVRVLAETGIKVQLNASGTFTNTSRLRNITASFELSSKETSSNGTHHILTLTAERTIVPGKYVMAVTGSHNELLYSKLISVRVSR